MIIFIQCLSRSLRLRYLALSVAAVFLLVTGNLLASNTTDQIDGQIHSSNKPNDSTLAVKQFQTRQQGNQSTIRQISKPSESYALINHKFFQSASQQQLSDTLVVLTIDGGGIYGIIPLEVLIELEARLKKPARDLFDVMAGTSTGSIIIAGLSYQSEKQTGNFSAKKILDLYNDTMQRVYSSSWWYKAISLQGLTAPKFNNQGKYQSLVRIFGDSTKLSQLSNSIAIIYIYSINYNNIIDLNSREAALSDQHDFNLVDTLMASTATPFFWRPVTLQDITKSFETDSIDAGLTLNNPGFNTILKTQKMFPNHHIVLLSLGTGADFNSLDDSLIKKQKLSRGLLRAFFPAFDLSITSQSIVNQQYIKNYFNRPNSPLVAVFRLNITKPTDAPSPLDGDPKNFAIIKRYADKMVSKNQNIIDQFIKVIEMIDEN